MVEYLSCPEEQRRELKTEEISRLTGLPPGLSLPPAMEKMVRESRPVAIAEKVSLAQALVRERIAYDTSPPTAHHYLRRAKDPPWLAKVLRIGKGDCDIINGLNVLLLRKMGIPSRLVIGMIGERGRVRPLLHAWSEYFDQGWTVTDASSARPVDLSITAGVSPHASDGPLSLPADDPRLNGPSIVKRLVGPALLLIMAALGGLLLVMKKMRDAANFDLPAAQVKDQLMQLVQQAMLQPEIWGRDNPLWSHRLLPTVDGKSMSVRHALRLLGRKRLFVTGNRNPLALAMMQSGITVLDLSQPAFAPLRTLLAGAIDTDMLCQLRPLPSPLSAANSEGDLLGAVSAFMGKMLKKPVHCLLAPGLHSADLLTIALPVPLRQSPFFFPQQFVAVNPSGTVFQYLSSVYRRNPPLAVFKFLQRLNSDGLLVGFSGAVPLKKAARRLLWIC
jgi:hypothetical protein